MDQAILSLEDAKRMGHDLINMATVGSSEILDKDTIAKTDHISG